ncbi:His Kinase A (phospho-acceptor) domain-containing protein [Mucilaginibacter pineti]|uniref:histidine kinase n=1 Tax=Mucilaginibacter pineti TaxID=1391627 RepID=A0A1G7LBM5_9SPHI|nr:HAMP domain-containing sensor histidine kinase [Mucilaginibacter pineti]SDF46855.1 His Kinase A (phospho-acceptor) domain-containing protein [Mucilaginibacter pineti]
MKKRIALILILMTVCVAGITGLQLYWNYQNYKSTVKAFNHDINEALNTAVDKEIDQRHQKIIAKFKVWLTDTAFVQITCDTNNRHGRTVFHMRDTHPFDRDEKGVNLGITKFKIQLNKITPAAKRLFIDHFGDNILKEDLKKGIVYNYTQRLGDSLLTVYEKSKLNIAVLAKLYKEELRAKDIKTSFLLNPKNEGNQKLHLTKQVNTALRRPYEKEMVDAGFQSPDAYYLKEMKWLIITSLLLIAITLFCFAYTVKTLLSQHKLALLKDDFINNMTHELNTPLASIKLTTDALKLFDHSRNTQLEYLDIIGYQTEKLTALTAEILNTGKVDQHIRENNATIDLNELIEKAIHDLEPQSKSNHIHIQYQPYADNVFVKGDSSSLLNTFINIMDNAMKYAQGRALLHIVLSVKPKYVEVMFKDNGIGIPEEYRGKVFDKFFRVPKGNKHDVKGYGLGLSYVKQVVEQHRGTIAVAANNPAGSIFTIKLPLG